MFYSEIVRIAEERGETFREILRGGSVNFTCEYVLFTMKLYPKLIRRHS